MSTTILSGSSPLIAPCDNQGNCFLASNARLQPGMTIAITDAKNATKSYKIVGISGSSQVTLGSVLTGRTAGLGHWLLGNRPVLSWVTQTIPITVPSEGITNKVVQDLRVITPTTPSSQGSGAVAPVVNVNVNSGILASGGILVELQALTSNEVCASPPVLTIGQSAVCSIYGYNATGTLTLKTVWGAVATTGTQIQSDKAVYLAANPTLALVQLGNTTINRTGDTTLTQSYDNTARDY